MVVHLYFIFLASLQKTFWCPPNNITVSSNVVLFIVFVLKVPRTLAWDTHWNFIVTDWTLLKIPKYESKQFMQPSFIWSSFLANKIHVIREDPWYKHSTVLSAGSHNKLLPAYSENLAASWCTIDVFYALCCT